MPHQHIYIINCNIKKAYNVINWLVENKLKYATCIILHIDTKSITNLILLITDKLENIHFKLAWEDHQEILNLLTNHKQSILTPKHALYIISKYLTME